SADNLPEHGPGRAADGNFVLTEFRIEDPNTNNIDLAESTATFEAPGFPASSTLAPNREGTNGWSIKGVTGVEQAIYFSAKNPIDLDGMLSFVLRQTSGSNQVLGHFRLSATTNPQAVRAPEAAPPKIEIAEILTLPADQRTEEQNQKLRAYEQN